MLFRKLREKRVNKIVEEIYKKNKLKRYAMLLVGCLIVAFAFNLFFLRYNIVCFGVSGISIVLSKFGVNPSIFIMLANLFLIIITYFFLGIDDVKNQIVVALTYWLFIELTFKVTNLIVFFFLIYFIGGLKNSISSD